MCYQGRFRQVLAGRDTSGAPGQVRLAAAQYTKPFARFDVRSPPMARKTTVTKKTPAKIAPKTKAKPVSSSPVRNSPIPKVAARPAAAPAATTCGQDEEGGHARDDRQPGATRSPARATAVRSSTTGSAPSASSAGREPRRSPHALDVPVRVHPEQERLPRAVDLRTDRRTLSRWSSGLDKGLIVPKTRGWAYNPQGWLTTATTTTRTRSRRCRCSRCRSSCCSPGPSCRCTSSRSGTRR